MVLPPALHLPLHEGTDMTMGEAPHFVRLAGDDVSPDVKKV